MSLQGLQLSETIKGRGCNFSQFIVVKISGQRKQNDTKKGGSNNYEK